MKRFITWIIVVLCLFNITTSFCFANGPLSDWKYYKSIIFQENDKYKAVYLDNEVYKHASSNLSDIRVVDNNNGFVSYYIQDGYSFEAKAETIYDTHQIGKHKEKNDTIYDFKVLPIFGAQRDIVGNSLIFTISEEFLQKIVVYGSYDNISWDYLIEDKIYTIENMPRLNVPLNGNYKYKYYRVKILNDIDNIQLDALKLKYSDTASFQSSYSTKLQMNYEIKNEKKSTLITLKNPDRLKIKTIHLNIDGNFNRVYEVYTKTGDIFTYAGISGNLYNLKFKDLSAVNTDINFGTHPISSEFIQVKIINLDDSPTNIKGLDTEYYVDKIVFESKPNTSYRLFFANSLAEKPIYDIESFKNHIELENQETCTLSKISLNPNAATDKSKAGNIPDLTNIFNIVIVIVSLGLIVLLVVKLKINKK